MSTSRDVIEPHDLCQSLVPVYETISSLLRGPSPDDARVRHRVGQLVSEIKRGEGRYGAHAVEQLACALGTNVHTLYRCASVAESWSLQELESLLARKTPRGASLSWSHLVTLAGIESPWTREELAQVAIRDGLSVRDLLELVATPGARGSSPRHAPLAVARRVVKKAERWSSDARQIHAELLALLDRASTDDDELAGLLERAIEAEERLHSVVEGQLTRLRAEYARLVRSALSKGERPSRVRVAAAKN